MTVKPATVELTSINYLWILAMSWERRVVVLVQMFGIR